MASNHTSHYDLNQWAASDKVLRAEFNADNAKVDAALAGLAEQVSGKASQTDLTSLTSTVATKASQSDLTSLTATVNTKANQSDLSNLTSTVNTKASQSALNTLTSTVNTKASQSDLNTLRNDMTAGDLWVKLLQYTSTGASTKLSIDVSGITFTNYWKVRILFSCAPCGSVRVLLNNADSYCYNVAQVPSGTSNSTNYIANLPNYSAGFPVVGDLTTHIPVANQAVAFWEQLASTNGVSRIFALGYCEGCKWEQLKSIQFCCESSIPAGAEVLIIGMPR